MLHCSGRLTGWPRGPVPAFFFKPKSANGKATPRHMMLPLQWMQTFPSITFVGFTLRQAFAELRIPLHGVHSSVPMTRCWSRCCCSWRGTPTICWVSSVAKLSLLLFETLSFLFLVLRQTHTTRTTFLFIIYLDRMSVPIGNKAFKSLENFLPLCACNICDS